MTRQWRKQQRQMCQACAAIALFLMATAAGPAPAEEPATADALASQFANPPDGARPRVWWHWINGNITKDGIAADLAWMKRVGIGGVQHFDVGLTQRSVVPQRLVFMTPPWQDAFRFAADTANRLGLEMTIASSPGWSESGGPWVSPPEAMKKLVWSEIPIRGGRHFRGTLPQPPTVTGPYQAMASSNQQQVYYADAAVLAYPEEAVPAAPDPRYTSASGEAVDSAALLDASLETSVTVPAAAPGEPPVVLMSYESPQTIRSATLFIRNAKIMFTETRLLPRLEVRDGTGWRRIADLPLSFVPTTISFAPVTAREFRVVVSPRVGARPINSVRIADLHLSALGRVNQFEVKAGFDVAPDYAALSDQANPSEPGVRADKVVDLTARMSPEGVLDWTAPAGHWRVLRLGYSLLGVTNHPAAQEATGLEVDKYDARVVRGYMQHLLEMYRQATGPDLFGSQGVRGLLTDSIEVGASNWTPELIQQFQRLRGYDPRPWLPTLTGVIVGSRAQSDAFLYDFRRTLADLIASEHYGEIARSAHEAGLKVYGESQEGGYTSLGDDMTMRAHADIPMAALWTFPRDEAPNQSALADMRGAASVAHVYGRNLAAAESMTSMMKPWAFAPSDLRRIIDLEFANGINRPVIHTSVHQPLDQPPGISLAVFGQYFTRLETWAEMARPWIDYISRNSFLLQQGRNVADVAYFVGEEGPLTALHGDEPVRYAYDFVNADMLLDTLSVEGDRIVSKGGASYRALYLGASSQRMTLPVLRRIAELVEAGGVVIGNAPETSPSLKDDPNEFTHLVSRLWARGGVNTVGKGRVVPGGKLEQALTDLGIAPDFSYSSATTDTQVLFVHRSLSDGDVYYLNNRRDRSEKLEAHFRVGNKKPEIWRADTGTREPVTYRIEAGQTVIPLEMAPEDSFFVVFREPATVTALSVSASPLVPAGELHGPWTVRFQAGRGASESIRLPQLTSLTEHSDPGVKYFSGIATYTTTFSRPAGAKGKAPLWLDLGRVGEVAEVYVNGKLVGTPWKPPFRVDIGAVAKRSHNTLEVRVADLWMNRLIGDAQSGAQKLTFTIFSTYPPNAPLRPSGLMGPVQFMTTAARNN